MTKGISFAGFKSWKKVCSWVVEACNFDVLVLDKSINYIFQVLVRLKDSYRIFLSFRFWRHPNCDILSQSICLGYWYLRWWYTAQVLRAKLVIYYIFLPLKRIFVFASETIADSLKIISIWFKVVFSRAGNLSNISFIDKSFFLIVSKAVSLSLIDTVFKNSSLFIVGRRWNCSFTFKSKLLTIAERSGPFS